MQLDTVLKCEECGIKIKEKIEDMNICISCFKNEYAYCEGCGYLVRVTDDNVLEYQGSYYCEDCTGYCESCDESYPLNLIGGDGYICIFCQEEATKRAIKPYPYKPDKLIFSKTRSKDSLFMGVELEVENEEYDTEEEAELFLSFLAKKNILENFFLKEDGSLNEGFEIVTHPFTLGYSKKLKFNDILEYLKKREFISHNSERCGLHVHLSKDFFNNKDITKIRSFFSLCRSEIGEFSRRHGDFRFCQFENYDFNAFLKGSYKEGRYWACNFNTNKNTIEIRVFKGTLNYESFMSCLEFCHAVSYFIKSSKSDMLNSIVAITDNTIWKTFKDFVQANPKYIHLQHYISKTNQGGLYGSV